MSVPLLSRLAYQPFLENPSGGIVLQFLQADTLTRSSNILLRAGKYLNTIKESRIIFHLEGLLTMFVFK